MAELEHMVTFHHLCQAQSWAQSWHRPPTAGCCLLIPPFCLSPFPLLRVTSGLLSMMAQLIAVSLYFSSSLHTAARQGLFSSHPVGMRCGAGGLVPGCIAL